MGGKDSQENIVNLTMFDSVSITLVFLHQQDIEGLINFVLINNEDLIPTFFAFNNFGQRQTKGFGSFSVAKIETLSGYVKEYNSIYQFFPSKNPWLKIPKVGKTPFEIQNKLFASLDFYWKCLKSGINYTKRIIYKDDEIDIKYKERYIKAFLYTYLQKKNVTWEKRHIKQNFGLETKCPQRKDLANPRMPVFGRAMLGLQEHFEYRVPQCRVAKDRFGQDIRKNGKLVEEIKTTTVTITPSEDIERIPSPIVFKPFMDKDIFKVYILIDEDVVNTLIAKNGSVFTFSAKGKDTTLRLDSSCIDYADLIKQYHSSLGYVMIPRDHNWKNILDDDKKGCTAKEENKIKMFVTP